MPASLAAASRGRPSRALASASRRALTRPSRSRRAKRRSSAAAWSVRIGKGAGTAASPRTMPPQRLKRPIDPSPFRPAGITVDASREVDPTLAHRTSTNDLLKGLAGVDTLNGNDGSDVLDGGP